MKIGQSDVRALEFHAAQVWDATHGILNAAAAAGAGVPTIPAWAALTEDQKSAWIMHPTFDRITSTLGGLAVSIVGGKS